MMIGKVKFFNTQKGFGFITVDGTGEEIFFHKTGVASGYSPTQNDSVKFETAENKKTAGKEMAVNVSKC